MAKTKLSCVRARGYRRSVFNGTARRTTGGLTKSDLVKNKKGRIVSKKKKARVSPGLTAWTRALKAEGYLKKGSFQKIPKRGTTAYKRVVARRDSFLRSRR